MRKRRMLIAIALIVIMLFNCVAPMLDVQAAGKPELTFNSALYKGLKAYFQEKGINASYNDGLHIIKMDSDLITSIEELSLKEKGISDLTGLEVFSGVKRLILSSNNLSEDSNLSVLNYFPNLTYLDISSNQISDVSSIQSLIERLIAADSDAVNLSGQIVKKVFDVSLKSSDQKKTETRKLPQILQILGIATSEVEGGIDRKGELKSDWISSKYNTVSNVATYAPYILDGNTEDPVLGYKIRPGSIPSKVTNTDNEFKIQVGVESSGFVQYQGLIKWVISIKDTSTLSAQDNPSAQNILKDSIFTLYYVVHTDEYEGVIFEDNNFYNAVKEQLTKNQNVNGDLLSYGYTTDENGEIYYDVCDVTLSGTTATLKINGTTVYTIDNFNTAGYSSNSVIRKGTTSNRYEVQYYEVEYVDTYNSSAVLTRTLKVKVPHYNADARNLYVDNYDEPYALVITDLDLVNKITSLILNDQRIIDLSGLEKFIGLDSNLNVSYNYIEELGNIYALKLNKDTNDSTLQSAFTSRKDLMATTKSSVTSAYSDAQSKVEAIKDEIAKIEQAISDASLLDTTASNYADQLATYANKVLDSKKVIEGDGTSDNIGLIGELNKILNDSSSGLNTNFSRLYSRLADMYSIFNKEYKLTSLLTPELNYQTEEEYDSMIAKMEDRDQAKSLATSEVSRIKTLEQAGALSTLEKDLIVRAFSLTLSDDEDCPISAALEQYISDLNDEGAAREYWVDIINKMLEIDIYAQAANYCLIERMNNSTATGACYAEEYLGQRIKDLDYEGIYNETLTAIYEMLSTGSTTLRYTTNLYNIFTTYEAGTRTCTSGTAYFCQGTYYNIDSLGYRTTNATASLGANIPYISSIKLYEVLSSVGTNNTDFYFYNQLMVLANKFVANNEVSRYIVLPALKRIDIRNNEIETLGKINVTMVSTDGTQRTTEESLSTLNDLKEFFAGHNLVTGDISNETVNWAEMTALKKLDLSYNYITKMDDLKYLTNLKYLNLSDNLLEGKFEFEIRRYMPKLRELILAGNKIDDISRIILDYDIEAGGDLTSYFAQEDTINIDLSRQELEIVLEEPIAYDRSISIYAVELPKIFAQLERIDAQRTAYGTTSSKGTITARGGVAYIPVSRTGEFAGLVEVIAANGYPEDVTTSIGIGTTCKIQYSVLNISVDSVTINEDVTRMERGTSATFTAKVEGENVPDTTVEWSVLGNASENTTITQDGLLTVAADETADEIAIIATSNYDDSKEVTKIISLYSREVTNVVVSGDTTVRTDATGTYIATVEGNNLEDTDKTVTWSVSGNTSSNTTISTEGVLSVGADETADSIVVTATSVFDTSKSGTITVTISKKAVTTVTVAEQDVSVRKGRTATFTATVAGTNLEDSEKTVTWSVSGNSSSSTAMTAAGVLTVGADETASTVTVTATSTFDTTKTGTSIVTVTAEPALPTLGYTLDSDDDIVGISPDTSSQTFKSRLVTDSSYIVTVKRNGTEIANTTSVATGDIVVISKDDEVVGTFEVVVKGDVNGDGTVDISDTMLVKSHRSRISTLTGLFFKAGDVDNDGEITISDVRLILAHRARIEGYTL